MNDITEKAIIAPSEVWKEASDFKEAFGKAPEEEGYTCEWFKNPHTGRGEWGCWCYENTEVKRQSRSLQQVVKEREVDNSETAGDEKQLDRRFAAESAKLCPSPSAKPSSSSSRRNPRPIPISLDRTPIKSKARAPQSNTPRAVSGKKGTKCPSDRQLIQNR